MKILVDSNVLLDVIYEDPKWSGWSVAALASCSEDAVLAINPVIYAEVSIGFHKIEEVDHAVPADFLERLDLPWEAAFLAGKCFVQYRRAGGQLRSPMPDFFIGAHAAVGKMPLLTRDPRRYRTYFPTVRLIAPPGT